MKNKKKAVAIALSAVLACGALAGCDALTTKDNAKDYAQIIAEVDISQSEQFTKEGGEFYGYGDFIKKAEITKQEMVASFVSNYSYLAQYGYDLSDIFDMIKDSLATRQIRVQYAIAYLAKKYATAENAEEAKEFADGDLTAYKSEIVESDNSTAAQAARLAFFLTDDEQAKADYDLRVSINSSLDNYESGIIKLEDKTSNTSSVRTLPTGVETEDEDYFATAEEYKIYTGATSQLASNKYETQDGSTPTTRKRAYNRYLANLRSNNFLSEDENISDFESTSYFSLQRKSQYETALINKVNDLIEAEASSEIELTLKWAEDSFNSTLETQKETYEDKSAFETAFDAISDTSFVLTPHDVNYGYVLNILLPFSTTQSQELTNATADLGDAKGNKFATRAKLLEKISATDQRGSWFTGSTDYGFEAESGYGLGENGRSYLFFENSLGGNAEYEKVKNYYGKYTYNGTVTVKDADAEGEDKYTVTPNKINIDDFLAEMVGYLNDAHLLGQGAQLKASIETKYTSEEFKKNYFATENFYYTENTKDEDGTEHKKGDVDYSKFVYAAGEVTGGDTFDANMMFVDGTWENTAFSVINELSFAYNTDTAGLNSYLGYMISPFQTSFVSEFEYAAQEVVKRGAGNFMVVPSDYGWHIIYCTFSFADYKDKDGLPFTFNYEQRKGGKEELEDSFSYLYFEQLKSAAISAATSDKQSDILNTYFDEVCTKFYEERYADLLNLI